MVGRRRRRRRRRSGRPRGLRARGRRGRRRDHRPLRLLRRLFDRFRLCFRLGLRLRFLGDRLGLWFRLWLRLGLGFRFRFLGDRLGLGFRLWFRFLGDRFRFRLRFCFRLGLRYRLGFHRRNRNGLRLGRWFGRRLGLGRRRRLGDGRRLGPLFERAQPEETGLLRSRLERRERVLGPLLIVRAGRGARRGPGRRHCGGSRVDPGLRLGFRRRFGGRLLDRGRLRRFFDGRRRYLLLLLDRGRRRRRGRSRREHVLGKRFGLGDDDGGCRYGRLFPAVHRDRNRRHGLRSLLSGPGHARPLDRPAVARRRGPLHGGREQPRAGHDDDYPLGAQIRDSDGDRHRDEEQGLDRESWSESRGHRPTSGLAGRAAAGWRGRRLSGRPDRLPGSLGRRPGRRGRLPGRLAWPGGLRFPDDRRDDSLECRAAEAGCSEELLGARLRPAHDVSRLHAGPFELLVGLRANRVRHLGRLVARLLERAGRPWPGVLHLRSPRGRPWRPCRRASFSASFSSSVTPLLGLLAPSARSAPRSSGTRAACRRCRSRHGGSASPRPLRRPSRARRRTRPPRERGGARPYGPHDPSARHLHRGPRPGARGVVSELGDVPRNVSNAWLTCASSKPPSDRRSSSTRGRAVRLPESSRAPGSCVAICHAPFAAKYAVSFDNANIELKRSLRLPEYLAPEVAPREAK